MKANGYENVTQRLREANRQTLRQKTHATPAKKETNYRMVLALAERLVKSGELSAAEALKLVGGV